MREAIGGTWIFSIVVVFIVLFTSYLAISVNYSKAFRVKNGIINIIEKREGLTPDTQKEITSYLSTAGYSVYSTCDTTPADNDEIQYKKGFESDSSGNKYKYCVIKTNVSEANGSALKLNKSYYKVTVFFRLDLPVIGDVFVFPVSGETKPIYYAED